MFGPWERFGALMKFVANCCKPRLSHITRTALSVEPFSV
jgi:hypothetical protein